MVKKVIFKRSIVTVLSLLIFSCKANYADIGYAKGLNIDVLMNIDSVIYIRANDELSGGLGFRTKSLTFVATGNENSAELGVYYYDRKTPFFISAGQDFVSGDLLYKIGTGYPLNEKVSVISHYSNSGLFIGFRRWL